MARTRILIGEDDPDILRLTTFRLEHEGYEVVPAADGDEVLHQAETQLPIHLILLDLKLPKRNGYEVCRILKQQGATAKIPVIVFTASESEFQKLADRCIEAGATDCIKKPFRAKELLEKIQHVLGEEGGRHG